MWRQCGDRREDTDFTSLSCCGGYSAAREGVTQDQGTYVNIDKGPMGIKGGGVKTRSEAAPLFKGAGNGMVLWKDLPGAAPLFEGAGGGKSWMGGFQDKKILGDSNDPQHRCSYITVHYITHA